MSIYKRKLRSGRRSKLFTAEFTFRGKTHREGGFPDRDSARQWIAEQTLRLRRHAKGYVKPMLASRVVPLITEFCDYLRGRGRDEMYCYTMGKRLEALAADCGWLTLGHVSRESLDEWMKAEQIVRAGANRGKPMGARTKNQYLDSATEFGKWLAKPAVAKLSGNPFAGMDKLPAKRNDAYRRAGTIEELNALLATCPVDRRACYVFRIYHASMRRRVMQGLTWKMMRLDANPPFALVPAELNKSRRDFKYVLRFDVAQELRAEKKRTHAKADDLVFPTLLTVDDLREDLIAADVAFEVAKNYRRLDFHAFRKTLVRLAKASGLSLDDASLLLGHKSSQTTRRYYDDDAVAPELGEHMEKLPVLGQIRRGA